MAIVVDSNLLIVLVNGDPRGEKVLAKLTDWVGSKIPLHAPDLLPYEVASALTRSIAAGVFLQDELKAAWDLFSNLPITYHTGSWGVRTVEIALSLERKSAYDAAYLALAEALGAELWTLDGPLYQNALNKGFSVKLLQS